MAARSSDSSTSASALIDGGSMRASGFRKSTNGARPARQP
jgi:hypothetical protein